MFQTRGVEELRRHFLYSVIFLCKSCLLLHNVEKCGRVEQATDDNIKQRMRIAW